MTGAILGHKELVTNYGLMSSVQEAASKESTTIAGQDSALEDDGEEGEDDVASIPQVAADNDESVVMA